MFPKIYSTCEWCHAEFEVEDEDAVLVERWCCDDHRFEWEAAGQEHDRICRGG